MKKLLSFERIRQTLSYNPETGEFTWIIATKGSRGKGSIAGSLIGGRVVIGIDYTRYLAHRLAWFWMTGEWAPEIDHINRNPSDNRWCNLRSVTRSQNGYNQGKRRSNTSGLKGVSFYKRTGRWRATFKDNYKQIHLGYFDSAEDAYEAYRVAVLKHHQKFCCLS